MKVKITDLLDHYYDDTVKLNEAPADSTTGGVRKSSHSFSIKKPLMAAAALLLILCGGFMLYLGFPATPVGGALGTGDTDGSVDGALISQEEWDFSLQDSVLPDPETEDTNTAPEVKAEAPETQAIPETDTDRFLVATLDFPIDKDAYLTDIAIDTISKNVINRFHIPALQEAFYVASPDGDMAEAMASADFMEQYSQWESTLIDIFYFSSSLSLVFGDTETQLGHSIDGFYDGYFYCVYPLSMDLAEETALEQYLDAYDADASSLRIRLDYDEYDLTPSPDYQAPDCVYDLDAASIVLPADSSLTLSAENDADGDGILTADLNIDYEYDGITGTIVKFTVDPSNGYLRWYHRHPYTSSDSDTTYIAWANYVLSKFQANAVLIFSDGTEVPVGGGDNLGYEEDLCWEESRLSWLAEDYDIDLDGKTVTFIKIEDQIYPFT